MPARNVVKTYVKDGYYHVYNRGVEKRNIFLDGQDYRVFLNILKEALLSPSELMKTKKLVSFKGVTFKGVMKPPKNFFEKIELLAFCLMPNHFHILLKQLEERSMHQFLQSICTRYVIYFNKKHKRVGALFQNAYKASLISDEPYLLHLSRYIHRNPLKYTGDLRNAYSSYGEYLGLRKTEWIKPALILSFFQPGKLPFLKHINNYQKFVEYETRKETPIEWYLDESITLEDDDE
jgi:putative transposase